VCARADGLRCMITGEIRTYSVCESCNHLQLHLQRSSRVGIKRLLMKGASRVRRLLQLGCHPLCLGLFAHCTHALERSGKCCCVCQCITCDHTNRMAAWLRLQHTVHPTAHVDADALVPALQQNAQQSAAVGQPDLRTTDLPRCVSTKIGQHKNRGKRGVGRTRREGGAADLGGYRSWRLSAQTGIDQRAAAGDQVVLTQLQSIWLAFGLKIVGLPAAQSKEN